MTYQLTGVLHSVDPATKQRRGFIEVGTDGSRGDVRLRTCRPAADCKTTLDTTICFRAEMAIAVAELMQRAACGPAADPSATKQAARKMVALHTHVALELVRYSKKSDVSERDFVQAIASALAGELRKGVALAQHANAESELLAALEVGKEPESETAGNGLGD
jgi:hypothetical protein